jgi:hypothetical protein
MTTTITADEQQQALTRGCLLPPRRAMSRPLDKRSLPGHTLMRGIESKARHCTWQHSRVIDIQ